MQIDCSCNEGKTHDGIESLGRNVMREVLQVLHERHVNLNVNKKMKLTIVGHSLGGLIARYLVKLLLAFNENSEEDTAVFHIEENAEDVKLHYQHFKEHVLPYLIPCVSCEPFYLLCLKEFQIIIFYLKLHFANNIIIESVICDNFHTSSWSEETRKWLL